MSDNPQLSSGPNEAPPAATFCGPSAIPCPMAQATLGRVQIAPRLLTKDQAAAYCGVSAKVFAAICPVVPISLGPGERLRRYDLRLIDRWIDRRAGAADQKDNRDWLAEMDNSDVDRRAHQRH